MANINAQFNYSANFGPVIGQMQKLTAEANLLNNTLQNLDKQAVGLKTSLASSFASDLGKIGGWNAKMVELTDSVDQFGQSLLKQKLTLRQYAQEAIGAFTKSSNAHKLAVREVAREMSQLVTLGKGMDGKQMGMMITPATINLKDFNTQMAVSQKQWSIFNSLVQDGTTHLINFGKNTQWAGRQITVGLTVPLTIYGNAVSKIFREVDAELTRFKKVYGSDLMNSTSDATDQMVSDVRNLAVEFSRSMGIAAKDTAALAADLAATGLEGQKLLAALRETTRLAVLGDVSNQDAMKTTLSLQNAFKISTDELAESVNFLNAVENQTSLSLQDLTTAIPKAGPVIKSLGGDVKDLSLLMVALKEGGISAAEGANALKSGMASLINPTKQASATAKQYGIDINGIVQANRGQLMPTIMAFQQQLELLDDFGKAQVIENVFGKYQFARLSALFDNLNASASQTNAVLGLMGQSNKELAATAYQEMDTLMNSSSKRFQRAIEGIKAQFITIGESITTSIIPIIENLSGKIGKAIEFFQNLPKPIKSFIKVAVGLTAVAGPIIMMVGIFSNFLGYVGKGAMGMVNLGRRMAGLPTQKFEMLSDTQIMAAKATDQLANSFDIERSSVERLNQALAIYRQNLVDAIALNPAFVNRQMPTPKPGPTTSGLDIPNTNSQPPKKLQSGGSAFVPGSGNGDKVPAMLEPGEYVVNKKAAAQNSALLDDINFRQAPRFQMGGRMPGYASKSYREPFERTDPEYETIFKWINGEMDYFRRRKNVKGRWTNSEKFDAERYQQLLSVMRSVPEGTKMMRGSVLNPGMSGEMSKESQLAMLTAIQTGDYGSLYGMDISFNDFASFASDAMGPQYGPRGSYGVNRFSSIAAARLYKPGLFKTDTPSGKFHDNLAYRTLPGRESKHGSSPVMYDFTAGPNTSGRDITMGKEEEGAPYPNYNPGWVSGTQINEILTHRAQGTITGVSSDLATRQPIIHIQGKQSGGRINGYANSSTVFAHSVPPQAKNGISLHYPIGFNISKNINDALNQQKATVKKQDLMSAINKPGSTSHMSGFFSSFAKKNPKSGINAATANIVKSETLQTLKDAPPLLNDPMLYKESLQSKQISGMYNTFKSTGFLSDFRANISEESLLSKGFKYDNNGNLVSPDKSISMQKVKTAYGYKWVEAKTGSTLGRSVYTGRQRSFTSNPLYDYLLGNKAAKKQSGGRINGYAAETTSWAKKAAAPKAYAGILQGIPTWATRPAEYEAIVSALRAAGIPEADRLAGYYIQDVLAHINPSTTNANGVYEKVCAAANLMKDSQVYNVFLETLNSRKDIGGLLNPSTVSRVAAASGLPVPVVQAELTKMADGVHPNTANGARVMMTLARLFPSKTSPGMPIAVAAGLGARLEGNFYDTLGQRALPSNLPNVTVRSYDPKGTAAPTSSGQGSKVSSSGLIMPSGSIRPSIVMPNIQSISSAAGGTGTNATVKVDGMGNVLSNGIDDMVANTVTGQPIAVSSKELLAVSSGGLIAGVTSPGDEARGKVVHPMGTALMRGKDFQEKRINGFAGKSMTEPVYDKQISGGSMGQFGGNAFMMISVMQQMGFALNQFTSDAQNGGSKFVAAMNLALTATQMMGSGVGNVLQGMADARKQNLNLISGLDVEGPKLDNRGKEMTKMSTGIGKLAGVAGKGMSMLGSLPVQIGLQMGIMAVTKTIELYQKAMVNAKKAGNAAFGEPTESAKLLGIELTSLTSGAEKLGKAAEKVFGAQGKGSYDKAFEKVVKTDYQDLINIISKAKTEQEQLNQLTNVYANLIQRGFDPKNAKELTAEIARQSQAMGAFNQASSSLDNIKNSKDAVKAQLETFQSQMTILEERRKLATDVGAKDFGSLALGVSAMVPGVSLLGRATSSALGSGIKTQSSDLRADAINEFFGVQGDEFWKKALRGTGLDRNPIAQALGGFLADQTMKTQMAAQLGATIKSIFSIAADNPTASNEALRMLVAQFKTVDWKKASEELSAIAEEKGFGDLSQVGTFIQSDEFKNLGEQNQTIFLAALNAGLGPQLEKDLANGWANVDWQKIAGMAAENQALVAIDVEVDIQIKDSIAQLEILKTAIQESFTAAIEAKQKELEFEDKRHEKTLKNLEIESQRLQLKKEILARNTEYYIKELQKEKEAEDFYSKQRQTGLGGLKAISQGDVFGFIGAQMDAATTADQFGRDRSIQNIQDTSDIAQAKIDQDLKGIEDRKAAETARHEAEIKNINAEMEFLQQKQSASVGGVDKAIKLFEKAMAMSPGDKGYQQAITDAQAAADQAGVNAQQIMQELKITSPDKDIQSRIDTAAKSLGDSLTIIANDTTNAVDRLNEAGTIASNVFASLGVDPAKSKAYKDLFDTLQKPLDPTVSAAIQAFTYGSVNNQQQGTLGGPDITNQNGSKTTTYKKNNIAVRGKTPYSPVTKADGGMLYGPGTGTSDSIPIMASNGEYVLRADVVKRIGKAKLDQINAGNFAVGGLVGSMPSMSSAPGMAAGGFVSSAPSAPKYNIPTAGVSASPSPIAQMAGGGMVGGASASHSAPTTNFHFNGAGMDMVMHHVNKQMGGRINSNSRRIG